MITSCSCLKNVVSRCLHRIYPPARNATATELMLVQLASLLKGLYLYFHSEVEMQSFVFSCTVNKKSKSIMNLKIRRSYAEVADNIVNREFLAGGVRKVLLKNITYCRWCYSDTKSITSYKYTCNEIFAQLKAMKFLKRSEGYIPTYARTDLTDDLHDSFGFRTDNIFLPRFIISSISFYTNTYKALSFSPFCGNIINEFEGTYSPLVAR